VCILIFYVLHYVSPYLRSFTVCFSFCMFFSVSRHIPGCTVCASHFVCFSLFLAIFKVLPCEFLIFLVCQYSHHFPDPTVCGSPFPCISDFLPCSRSSSVCVSFSKFFRFLTILKSYSVFLIFYAFHYVSPYSRSYSVCFSFCKFFSVSHHIPGPPM
jgi:hypothetical protein